MALLLSSLSLQSFQRPVDHTSFKAGTLALMLHGTEQLTAPLYITDHNLPLTLTQIRIIYAQAIKVNCYFLLTFAKLVFFKFQRWWIDKISMAFSYALWREHGSWDVFLHTHLLYSLQSLWLSNYNFLFTATTISYDWHLKAVLDTTVPTPTASWEKHTLRYIIPSAPKRLLIKAFHSR